MLGIEGHIDREGLGACPSFKFFFQKLSHCEQMLFLSWSSYYLEPKGNSCCTKAHRDMEGWEPQVTKEGREHEVHGCMFFWKFRDASWISGTNQDSIFSQKLNEALFDIISYMLKLWSECWIDNIKTLKHHFGHQPCWVYRIIVCWWRPVGRPYGESLWKERGIDWKAKRLHL